MPFVNSPAQSHLHQPQNLQSFTSSRRSFERRELIYSRAPYFNRAYATGTSLPRGTVMVEVDPPSGPTVA
jgi:hypothetical protein